MSVIIWTNGSDVAPNKLEGGHESDGSPIYVAHAYFKDGIHPGKFSSHTQGKASIGYGGKEYLVADFQVAQSTATLTWVSFSGAFSLSTFKGLGKGNPVEGGSAPSIQARGKVMPLYICRAAITDHQGKQVGTHCGKVWEGAPSAIPYGTEEYVEEHYEVLAYKGN